MFIMPARKNQQGKTYTYYNLVNTVRTPKGPRHQVLLSLGSLPNVSQDQIRLLGRLIDEKLGGTIRLLPQASAALEQQAESGLSPVSWTVRYAARPTASPLFRGAVQVPTHPERSIVGPSTRVLFSRVPLSDRIRPPLALMSVQTPAA